MSGRDMSKVSFEDLQFEGGRLAKVNPYDRPQYMDGYELLALVHRLAVLLKEATSSVEWNRTGVSEYKGNVCYVEWTRPDGVNIWLPNMLHPDQIKGTKDND